MTPVTDLLAELAARGIILEPHGDRLRYRPRSAMTPELAGRVRACKGELLAMLAAGGLGDAPPPEPGAAIPSRPADRAGFVTELILRGGRLSWRQRRADEADRAWAMYANRQR